MENAKGICHIIALIACTANISLPLLFPYFPDLLRLQYFPSLSKNFSHISRTQSATKSTIARQVSASRGPKTGANYFDKWPRNCPPLSTATNKDDCWDWDAAGSEDLAAAVAL